MKEYNILQYLKDTDATQVYSPTFGIGSIVCLSDLCITVDFSATKLTFDHRGRLLMGNTIGPECSIFLDKGAKWEDIAPQYEIGTDLLQFKPFDKVLVRDDATDRWIPAFFQEYNSHSSKDKFPYIVLDGTGGTVYKQCIPYNEETKHLIFTTQNYQNHE